jgi:choice-of-anchor B domain-containing protein
MVLDLSDLPNGIERVNFSSDFRAAHNAYLVNADYTYGLALSNDVPQLGIAGGNTAGGNHRLYSLADPRAPQLLSVSAAGYAHDLASVPIGDARKNSQCVNAQAAARCQVLSDFNENTVDVWDITNPSAPQLLSSQQYTNFGYVHSGWWTEDGRYLLVHDELDERDHGLNTTVRVFDLANLLAPVLAGSWVGPTRAIDHNGYVKGNRYYVSNYSEGLTVLDLTDPTAPTRVGYFDTFAGSSVTNFVGAWGVYPFFASGTIAVGDINSGLYLLRNETLGSAAGSFAIANAALAGTEGETLSVTVNRSAGAGAVSVDLEMLAATATAADATLAATTLNWAAGETQPKTAALTLTGDAVSEGLELLLLRLKSPRGGATIAYPDTTAVSIAEPGATTRIRLLDYALAIDDARGKALVTVTRHGSAGGEARVSFRTLTGGTHGGVTPAQGELVWANGEAGGKVASVELNPATLGGGQSATIQMEFSNAVNASLEAADGSPVLVVPLTVTVSDSGSPSAPPPSAPPPPSGSGGGGGTFSLLALLVLGALLARRRRFV